MFSRRYFTGFVFSTLLAGSLLAAAPPAPKEHFGFTPGDDYKLAGYDEITGYFRKLAESSPRVKMEAIGKSSEGRGIHAVFISSEANLRDLERHKQINRRLALGLATAEEAKKLAAEGKAIVWIDSGLHATEVAPVQHAPHLAYRMVTGEDEETRRIRENVILIQIPVINPDGLDLVVSWYKQNLGTDHELAPLTKLYQKYSGHDNNRDYFMLNLAETRHVSRMLFREWFPQIVYNQHQVAPFPARIFVPPYGEPLNPHIPAPVMEGINLIGSAMKERFARENKPGVVSYVGFDAWWNGGLRSAPAFHNMHGILTETALYQYATPREYKASEFPATFASGIPTKEPTVFYERPWLGGRWALMDAVNYMLTADFAILELAAARRQHFLTKAWEMATAQIEAGKKGGPFAYVVDPAQEDDWTAVEMLKRLQGSGVEVRKTTAAFSANGKTYAAGTYLLPAAQPFRAYLMDLMEPQKYPEIRAGQTGPTKRPYDLAGWTLPYQMGVKVERIEQPVEIKSEPAEPLESPEPSMDVRKNSRFLALARSQAARKARVALYEPYTANMDAGWTEWVLDYFEVKHTKLHNEEIRRGGLRDRYDVIILAAQSMASILHGVREGELSGRAEWQAPSNAKNFQRPEYTGGIGLDGARNLLEFARGGGTLIAFDTATELILDLFPVGVRGVLRGGDAAGSGAAGGWYCPGSILRVDVNQKHPLSAGMPAQAFVTSTGGQAFEISLAPKFNKGEREVTILAAYAKSNLLASGWLSGERAAAGKAAAVEARVGAGRVVLFGFRPQFRGQTFGTFKFFLNAIYPGTSENR
jgi:hypothetical protein